ncbi:MAG TPA: helix-turn-helix domain-containing protein [Solirubrobacterales bacterium]|nr:helix-turn-helix domain-containing protein [Solirubrobacterales bacterium]
MSQPIQIQQDHADPSGPIDNGHDGSGQLDWGALLSRSIHPTRLWIIEAMRIIDRPLSASELEHVLDRKHSTSAISYHMNTLAKIGIVKQVEMQQVRGAWKRLYVFTAAVKPAAPAQPRS